MKDGKYYSMSKRERVLRALLGMAALSLAFVGPQTPYGYVGILALLSGASGFCPIYAIHRRRKEPLGTTAKDLDRLCWNRDDRKSSL